MEFHVEGVEPSGAHDALVHCLAGIRLSAISNGTIGWQHLLHQYDVAIITAINLNARIDENEAGAS